MKTSFLLFANRDGIVCGSSADMTIFQLSKKEPVAIAATPQSKIPWRDIIENYQRKGEPLYHNEFELYIKDFESYLSTITAKSEWQNLDSDESKLVFMGYGLKNIYPCVYDVHITFDIESEALKFDNISIGQIDHITKVYWSTIGNFEQTELLFKGATTPMNDLVTEKVQAVYKAYIAKVKEKFAGTEYEQMVMERIAKFDENFQAQRIVRNALRRVERSLQIGVDTFSVADMVDAVETIINANMRLSHLQSGGNEPLGQTHEIAVITRVEGLIWIKHSLFAI